MGIGAGGQKTESQSPSGGPGKREEAVRWAARLAGTPVAKLTPDLLKGQDGAHKCSVETRQMETRHLRAAASLSTYRIVSACV